MPTDFVIIIPPAGEENGVYPPYGALYIAAALRKDGYNPQILNVDADRLSNRDVAERIKQMKPRYIGFSGIVAPSYTYIKELSIDLKKAFPDKRQILGGGLSSAAEVVLKNTPIDIVVRGEGDLTIVELMRCLDAKGDLRGVLGISYKDASGYVRTEDRRLIGSLDTLPYPAFDLVDMNRYLPDGPDFIQNLTKCIKAKDPYLKKEKRKMMTIPTSRGCFNECSFCFRAYRGLRVHSIKYVFDLVEYCIDKFDAGFFTFGDECFAPNVKRNWDFIEEFKKRKLDITFRIFGMRVDTVDREILEAYKDIGCWMIEYGFESGSQKMLNIIGKRVTVEQNRNAAVWTNEAGIFTSPALVLGMPGETDETIGETIEFLKSINFEFKQYQWKYAIPIPGSQLYDFAKLTGVVEDENAYLSSLVDGAEKGDFNTNLTDQPDEVVARWAPRLKEEMDRHHILMKYGVSNPFISKMIQLFMALSIYKRQGRLMEAVKRLVKRLCRPFFKSSKTDRIDTGIVRFRKKRAIKVESFFEGIDTSLPDNRMSLRNINMRVREMGNGPRK